MSTQNPVVNSMLEDVAAEALADMYEEAIEAGLLGAELVGAYHMRPTVNGQRIRLALRGPDGGHVHHLTLALDRKVAKYREEHDAGTGRICYVGIGSDQIMLNGREATYTIAAGLRRGIAPVLAVEIGEADFLKVGDVLPWMPDHVRGGLLAAVETKGDVDEVDA